MRDTQVRFIHDNLLHNLNVVMQQAPHAKCLAMVKGNAYGHGIVETARLLAPHVDVLGVCCFEEAMQIRDAGIESEIVLCQGVFDFEELKKSHELGFQFFLQAPYQIDWLEKLSEEYSKQIWFKMNTGMNRLGFGADIFHENMERILALGYSPVLTMHLANAGDRAHMVNEQQFALFDELTANLNYPKSCLNSAGIITFPERQYDYVRPGLALYGISPIDNPKGTPFENLKPVMQFESTVVAIQNLKAGESVGYSSKWIAERPSTIAIIAAGYGDGYPRDVPNGTKVMIEGLECPTVGNVSMDSMAVDITHAPESIKIGGRVLLWGEGCPVEVVSDSVNRIPYELVTQITTRPYRVYE